MSRPLTDAADARAISRGSRGDNTSDDVKQVRIEGEQKFDGVFNALKFGFLGPGARRLTIIMDAFVWECAYCGYQLALAAEPEPASRVQQRSGRFLGSSTLPTQWLTFDPKQLLAYYLTDAALAQSLKFFSGQRLPNIENL